MLCCLRGRATMIWRILVTRTSTYVRTDCTTIGICTYVHTYLHSNRYSYYLLRRTLPTSTYRYLHIVEGTVQYSHVVSLIHLIYVCTFSCHRILSHPIASCLPACLPAGQGRPGVDGRAIILSSCVCRVFAVGFLFGFSCTSKQWNPSIILISENKHLG